MATYIKLSDGVKKGFEQDMVAALTTLGYKAMTHAYAQRNYTHRTRNLHDSYASAVYLNGKLIESSIKYLRGSIGGFKRDRLTKKTGRQTVNDYLHSHSFGAKNNEIVLVVVAAMYYAGILEAGGATRESYTDDEGNEKTRRGVASKGPGARYIVISPAREYISTNWESATREVYKKYGIKDKARARVIRGERLSKEE